VWHLWGRGDLRTGVLVWKPEGKSPLGRLRNKGVILKWISRKYDGKSVDWIDLAKDRERWWPVVNTVTNLPVAYNEVSCLKIY